ncbi:hypothetical protein VMCG_05955 [Cytospora schulzeri]|uniref:CFEM domain-containing protein n=1 Tax=Cytospora schulzeri TaxID=448051 RepID=A0A423WD24_9PEZI|nr:hypothetical protein VMCG_05955 [Valsa malicola]
MASFMAIATPRSTLAVNLCKILLCLLIFGSRIVTAQAPPLSSLPPCGLSCFLGAIPHSGCDMTDSACQCSSSILLHEATTCLTANCSMQDGLDMARFEAANCGFPNESRSSDVMIIMSALYGVTVVFVALRILSKMITHTFCAEDHMIISAVIISAAPFACVVYMAELGFGSHLWDLEDGALLRILRLLYVAEIIYIIVLTITKASILCMYLRIFWAYPPFQITCYVVLAFVIVSSAAITIATIVSCEPVRFFWNRDLPGGSCLDVTALAYANSGLAVAQDLIITLLPIYMLWSLNMSRKKKFFIGIMFAVGGLGLIATIVRLKTLSAFGDMTDPAWSYVPLVYWTTVELAAGIVASCLPSVRILLERFFKVFNVSSDQSKPPSAINLQHLHRKPSAPEDPALEDYGASQTRLTRARDGLYSASLRRGDEHIGPKQDLDWG